MTIIRRQCSRHLRSLLYVPALFGDAEGATPPASVPGAATPAVSVLLACWSRLRKSHFTKKYMPHLPGCTWRLFRLNKWFRKAGFQGVQKELQGVVCRLTKSGERPSKVVTECYCGCCCCCSCRRRPPPNPICRIRCCCSCCCSCCCLCLCYSYPYCYDCCYSYCYYNDLH